MVRAVRLTNDIWSRRGTKFDRFEAKRYADVVQTLGHLLWLETWPTPIWQPVEAAEGTPRVSRGQLSPTAPCPVTPSRYAEIKECVRTVLCLVRHD
jgi:hypothetical protein